MRTIPHTRGAPGAPITKAPLQFAAGSDENGARVV